MVVEYWESECPGGIIPSLLVQSMAVCWPHFCAAAAEEIFQTCPVQFSGADFYQFLLAGSPPISCTRWFVEEISPVHNCSDSDMIPSVLALSSTSLQGLRVRGQQSGSHIYVPVRVQTLSQANI